MKNTAPIIALIMLIVFVGIVFSYIPPDDSAAYPIPTETVVSYPAPIPSVTITPTSVPPTNTKQPAATIPVPITTTPVIDGLPYFR